MRENEIINLILGIASVPLFLFGSRAGRMPGGGLMYTGFFLVVSAYFFSVVEEYFFFEIFNLLEHISLALAGILFAAGCRALKRAGARREGPGS